MAKITLDRHAIVNLGPSCGFNVQAQPCGVVLLELWADGARMRVECTPAEAVGLGVGILQSSAVGQLMGTDPGPPPPPTLVQS